MKGWINIYRSGIFHRIGKPGAFDRHPGDIYPTEEAAIQDIEPRSHYITTVPVEWSEEGCVECNPPTSKPTPLSVTRRDAGYSVPKEVLLAEARAHQFQADPEII
jgi:hypothetical protein